MVTGTNERFLQPSVALETMFEAAEPNLSWIDYVTPFREEKSVFQYAYNDTNKSGDAKKKKPALMQIGGLFPEIDMSRGSISSKAIDSHGFSIRLPRTLMRGPGGANEIKRVYETAGFWMSEVVNTNIITALKAGANTSFSKFSPTVTWDDDNATPISDLRDFARDQKQEKYPYRMTDIFLYENNWYEMVDYLANMDIDEYKQKSIFGTPTVDSDTITVPMAGLVHSLMSGMSEGETIGLDGKNPVADLHYYNDPKFSVPTFNYETIVDGNATMKAVPNMGFNFFQYEEDDTHDIVFQFWNEQATVVTNSKGIMYSSSGV